MRRYLEESMPALSDFKIRAVYSELTRSSSENVNYSHIHDECEIYVNLSGDVSFIVENKIYPVKPGDIIISKPFEYHHCVYHSEKLHKLYCIWFDVKGNEKFFDIFFKRKAGEGNLLTIAPSDSEAFLSLCNTFTLPEKSESRKYKNFFMLIDYLSNATSGYINSDAYPDDVIFAINYINKNFSTIKTVEEISREANVSVNTLERHFKTTLNISPSEYLKKQRLANAAKLLSEGATVTEASDKSGFPDYSWFIALFKKHYGITPNKYKKNIKK
jgi:AraC-like DNA-binding protein